MKFSELLHEVKRQRNCKSDTEFYRSFGGEPKLGISERTFRATVHGQLSPTVHTFSAIFGSLPSDLKKDAIIAFFESALEQNESSEVVSYLEEKLTVAFSEDTTSLWNSGREAHYFSEKQLTYLAQSNETVRIYDRIMTHVRVPIDHYKTAQQRDILANLVKLGIIQQDGNYFKAVNTLFRLPNQDNSPKELVGPTNDFIMRHLSSFVAREGAPKEQELGFSFHTCMKRDAEKILEQMRYFKRWVQNFGLKEDHPDEVTFVWVDFARIIMKNRDY